jgi:hypothetical protein
MDHPKTCSPQQLGLSRPSDLEQRFSTLVQTLSFLVRGTVVVTNREITQFRTGDAARAQERAPPPSI